MSVDSGRSHLVACACGQVVFEAAGAPILTTVCDCASCREAGRRLEALPGAAPVRDADGGTSFVLHRKDRVRCTSGGEQLKEYRLRPDSPTRRVVATCCNSAMFLEFSKGHWLSLYRNRIPGAPPVEMRVMTRDRPDGAPLDGNVPAHATHSVAFMWRLFAAWFAMGLRTPRGIDGTKIEA